MGDYLNLRDRLYIGVGEYNIPQIVGTNKADVSEWARFNAAKSINSDRQDVGVHFFIEDPQFERVWNLPQKYVNFLTQFKVCLSPDFSLYRDFPKSIQIFNHYRKHWLGAFWEEQGLTVIPTIAWSDKDSFNWCFDGEPENSIVAVSNVGCMRSKEGRQLFINGYNEMITRLQPLKILLFGHKFDDYKGNVEYINYQYFKRSNI